MRPRGIRPSTFPSRSSSATRAAGTCGSATTQSFRASCASFSRVSPLQALCSNARPELARGGAMKRTSSALAGRAEVTVLALAQAVRFGCRSEQVALLEVERGEKVRREANGGGRIPLHVSALKTVQLRE